MPRFDVGFQPHGTITRLFHLPDSLTIKGTSFIANLDESVLLKFLGGLTGQVCERPIWK